jgi:hypothetical protein
MSTITITDKAKLEKLFGMRTDANLGDFLAESVAIHIHDIKYQHHL